MSFMYIVFNSFRHEFSCMIIARDEVLYLWAKCFKYQAKVSVAGKLLRRYYLIVKQNLRTLLNITLTPEIKRDQAVKGTAGLCMLPC